MNETLCKLGEVGIVPVVVMKDAGKAEGLGEALMKGGLPCAEVTFRTEAAADTIRILKDKYPSMLVGAGTVLTTEQVDRAMDAGASFIVSPGLNPKTVTYCLEKGYPVLPGVMTPSEIEMALSLGLTELKFFPAEAAGGLKMLKALCAPYTMMKFMPTGGISAENAADYLAFNKIFCCGGSWMVKGDLIDNDNFDEIERLSREAAQIVKKARCKE